MHTARALSPDTPPPSAILDACALALSALAAVVCEPLPSDAAPRVREQSLRRALAACAGALCAALEQPTAEHLDRAARALCAYAKALEQLAPHLGADLDAWAREGAGEARAHAACLVTAGLDASFRALAESLAQLPGGPSTPPLREGP